MTEQNHESPPYGKKKNVRYILYLVFMRFAASWNYTEELATTFFTPELRIFST